MAKSLRFSHDDMSGTADRRASRNPIAKFYRAQFEKAGITINGSMPWDLKLQDPRLFRRLLIGGSLALGETYMDQWWDCDRLDIFFDRLLSADLDRHVPNLPRAIALISAALRNAQSIA